MLCALLISAVDLAFPMLTRYVLSDVVEQKLVSVFIFIIIGLVLGYVLKAVLQYLVNFYGHSLGARMEADMRRDIFAKLERLPFSFFDGTRTGHLISRVTSDLFDIVELAHHGPENIFISAVMFIGSFIALLFVNWQLALILFAILPVFIMLVMKSRNKMDAAAKGVKEKTAGINAAIESSISGIRVSKAFANEEYEIEKFNKSTSIYQTAKDDFYKWMGVFQSSIFFEIGLLNVIVLAIGGAFVLTDKMSVIDLVTFNLYVTSFLTPIQRMSAFTEMYSTAMAGFERFLEVMDTEESIRDCENPVHIDGINEKISFKNVTFSYDGTKNVLSNVDLTVEKGKCIALVGPSGGGKTTICQLLPRFYDVTDGAVEIDGVNVKDISLRTLRSVVGIVQQDVFLFATTIRENIAYGKIDATDDEIIAAAKAAEIHDFIMTLEKGYDTHVGERGVLLSGGQKQRISIARLFLKNPPILILDEATSALDTETEYRIQSALDRLSEGRTRLIIAHRLSTIKNADEIIFIDSEGIAERGSHESLLASNGGYAKLYNM